MNKEEKERRQNKFENDLKEAGYYDGKPVIIIAGIDGLRVKHPEPNKEKGDLRPVHCRCNL